MITVEYGVKGKPMEKPDDDSLWWVVWLMVGFFIVFQSIEILNATQFYPKEIDSGPAHNVFMTLLGVVIGAFRSKLGQAISKVKEVLTNGGS